MSKSAPIEDALKWQYFEESWESHPQWLVDWKPKIKQFWLHQYKDRVSTPSATTISESSSSASSQSSDRADDNTRVLEESGNVYVRHLQAKMAARPLMDDYQRYITSPIIDELPAGGSRITWWLEPSQQHHYPNLSRMAIDLLSIPAQSADAERLFLSAKLTITTLRNRLAMETL